MKGQHHTELAKTKISKTTKGVSKPFNSHPLSEKHKDKLRESHKGQIPWNKGKGGAYLEYFKQRRKNELRLSIYRLDKSVLGYIAGIIDGEGSISLHKKDKYIYPRIDTTMTDLTCVEMLHRFTEVGSFRYGAQHKNRKPLYVWAIGRKNEINGVLKAILPYLIVKRKHAEIVLKFLERRMLGISVNHVDLKLWEEIRELNKVGCS